MSSTTIETTSPLYLHPSEGSESVVVQQLQGSSNYRTWKRSMEVALTSKRKLGFVTGSVVRDKSDPVKQEEWDACNSMIISWIFANVNETIKQSIMFMGSASDMWKNMEQRFTIAHGARKYPICKQIFETKQKGRPVNDYYTQLQMLWEELENLTTYPPISEMNPEMVNYVSFRQKQQEEMKLFQFLNGLDEVNSPIRTHILMRTTLPDASKACSIISQEESQREVFAGAKDENEGLAMFSKSSTPPVCNACGKSGHSKEKCWTVVGYPPWFNKQSEGKGKERSNKVCNIHLRRVEVQEGSTEEEDKEEGELEWLQVFRHTMRLQHLNQVNQARILVFQELELQLSSWSNY